MLMNIEKQNRQELANLIEKYAKYQKVMLVYDQYTSNLAIQQIYQTIKDLCVFNSIQTGQDMQEIYNGYKLLIFLCEPESFLHCNLNIEEFVNIVITNTDILPFCLDSKNHIAGSKIIFLSDNLNLDKPAYSSLNFNLFYNNLLSIYNQTDCQIDINIKEISTRNLFQILNSPLNNFEFVDIDILRKSKLTYQCLPIVDFVLMAGFDVFFNGIKNHTLLMTDLYKSIKENSALIDKYYALSQNDALITMVELNFGLMQNKIKQTFENINEFLTFGLENDELKTIIFAVRDYAKNCSGLLNYLYLYKIFD